MATKKQIKAVGYARRSTDMQERSIPDQKAYIEKWADANGYRILRWYIDDAISGTSTKGRKAFDELIAAAENGRDFDTVICYDISRFSRGGTNETGYYLYRLQMAGVQAIFPADSIPEGDEGELLQGVKSWQAKQYTVKLSRDVIRGNISSVTIRHSAPGGPPPYGYDKQHVAADGTVLRTFRAIEGGRKKEFDSNGKLLRVLNPGEIIRKSKSDICRFVPSTPDRVATVKRIFKQSIAGCGGPRIAYELNQEGVPTANGKPWTSDFIRGILRNPTYRGAIVWNRRTMSKLNGVDGKGNLRPRRGYTLATNKKEDWYIVEGVHEPLVSPETFEKAQQATLLRSETSGIFKRKKRNTNNKSLLAGLISCVHCGSTFHQTYCEVPCGKHKKKKFYYYRDTGYSKEGYGGKCNLTQVPMQPLNQWVMEHVLIVLLGDKKNTESAIKKFIATVRRHEKEPADTDGLKKKLSSVTKRIQTTVAMLADPEFDGLEELKTTLATLKRQRDSLEKSIDETDQPNTLVVTEPELHAFALKYLADLKDIESEIRTHGPETRQLIGMVIDRIEIDGKTKTGTLYLYGDLFETYQQTLRSYAVRGDHQTYYKSIRVEQADMASVVLDQILAAWMYEAMLSSEFAALRTLSFLPHQWFFDGTEHVDPAKEANAQKTRLDSNTTTLAAEFARQGKDWETELTQRAKEKQFMAELGLTDQQETVTVMEKDDDEE